MTEPKGNACPDCGALRDADNTPSCACTQRASDALRDARTAEQAAAEDFDPLRIRPYVDLNGRAAPEPPGPPAEATMPLRAVDAAGPARVLGDAAAPHADDLSLFDAHAQPPGAPAPAGAEGPPRSGRRRRTVLLGAAGAAVAVVAAAGFASGLFSYETPSRDSALPEDVREAAPAASTAGPDAPTPSASTASASPSASASSSADESPSPSPTPSASSASPTPSGSATPTPSTSTARATESGEPDGQNDNGNDDGDNGDDEDASVLRRGDRGPEVAELQMRLKAVYLYTDEVDGHFTEEVESALRNYQWSRGVQGDELGVYGSATRERLEAETGGR